MFHIYQTIVLLVGTIVTLGSTFEISDFLCHSCRGADPDSLDTNGNNICHMMVILNKVRSILMSSAPFQTFDLDVSLQNHDDSVQCLSQAQLSQNDCTLDSGILF